MANVNRPTNVKARDENIDQKLQLFGIYNGFKTRKLPSNEQVDVALNSFIEHKALKSPSDKLSSEGRELVADSREVVRLMKYLFLSKNEDNLLQDFIWQTGQFDAKSIQGPGTPVDKKTAQQQGNEALEGLRTLGKLLITNGQFRKLLSDFTIIFRDIAGDAASNAAGRVRPSEDDLNQVDMPAQDNTWHEAPKLEKGAWKQQMKGIYGGAKKDTKETTDAAVTSAQPGDQTRPTGEKAEAGVGAAKSKLKQTYDENVSDEAKEKIKARNEDYKRRAREYFNKKMPQERKDQTIWRLKKMVLECQQHPDYKRAVQTLLDLAEEYGRHGRSMAKDSTGTVKQTRTNLQKALDDLKIIIERFANGTSTDPLWNHVEKLSQSAREDKELRDWFGSMNSYIRRCLLEQGYILEDSSNTEWDHLYDRGRYLLRTKYRGQTDKILDETRFIMTQFEEDPQNKEFGEAVERLFLHLGQDENGKPTFKPHLLRDLRDVIIPAFVENVEYIPVPRIEYQDPQVDLVIENLIFEGDNLFPNVVEITSNNYFKMGRRKIPNDRDQMFDVRLAGIQMDLRDVSYYVNRKSGFPSITDTGRANISLAGNGLTFQLQVATAHKHDKEHFLKVGKVDVDISHLKVKLVESRYKTPFNLLAPILIKVLRPVIQKVVEKNLRQQFSRVDRAAWEIKQDADRVLEESKKASPKEKVGMYNRYFESTKRYAKKRKEEQKKKAAEKTSESKVNIAYTMHDSIFPNVKLPGATSEKATKYKDLAAQGDRWESPVFSIGHASQSGDIPRAPKIQDKLEQKRAFGEKRRREAAAAEKPTTGATTGAGMTGTTTGAGMTGTPMGAGMTGTPMGAGMTGTPMGAGMTGTTAGGYNESQYQSAQANAGMKQFGNGGGVGNGLGAGVPQFGNGGGASVPQFQGVGVPQYQGAGSGAPKPEFGSGNFQDGRPLPGQGQAQQGYNLTTDANI